MIIDWLVAMFLIQLRDAFKQDDSRVDEIARSLTYQPTILKRRGWKLIEGDKITEVENGDR